MTCQYVVLLQDLSKSSAPLAFIGTASERKLMRCHLVSQSMLPSCLVLIRFHGFAVYFGNCYTVHAGKDAALWYVQIYFQTVLLLELSLSGYQQLCKRSISTSKLNMFVNLFVKEQLVSFISQLRATLQKCSQKVQRCFVLNHFSQ